MSEWLIGVIVLGAMISAAMMGVVIFVVSYRVVLAILGGSSIKNVTDGR